MNNLLYKEFRLAIHPSVYIFLSFGALLLIPSWPFFIAFGYLFLGFMNTFLTNRSNHDIIFTALLPVPKREVVRARVRVMAIVEVLQIVVAVPFAYLNTIINPHGNQGGMNPNIAFLGIVFMVYAVFNSVFLPMYYKTAHKVGIPIFAGTAACVIFVSGVEVAVHTVPFLNTYINAFAAAHLFSQLVVLLVGISIFLLATLFAYKRAAGNFEKLDL
jgi:hypothetical protein